ncbi:MAG TPA: PqqD family peptide modification chaperone [Anaerolineae bacterium]|nr:PqqD family peptide modification chaperone [Anaerolineae bacterium]HQK13129.1 PqqD family peptide modification chaperone [Anaerolineae bacterium]
MDGIEPALYLVNPDVSCREEGPDGALLFNPDTDAVLVINTTGLLIWETLHKPCDKAAVVAALMERCDNVPVDSVAADVDEFIEQLIARGFVGVYQGTVQF